MPSQSRSRTGAEAKASPEDSTSDATKAARWRPRVDQDPGSPHATAKRIVEFLDEAVRVGRPENGPARLARPLEPLLDRLAAELETHLVRHGFLRLEVWPDEIRHDGIPVLEGIPVLDQEEFTLLHSGQTPVLAALLHAADILEVYFKQGVQRLELEKFVTALQRTPFGVVGADSAATLLWECALERIAFRCREDLLPPAHDVESFDLANEPVERADELTADVSSDPAYSAASAEEEFPALDLDRPPRHLRWVLHESAGDREALGSLGAPGPEEALGRLATLVMGVQQAEKDSAARELALNLLARVLDLQIRAGAWSTARDLLANAGAFGAPESLRQEMRAGLRRLADTLSAEAHLVRLGEALEERKLAAADRAAVRQMVGWLGDTALESIWNLLSSLQDAKVRERICVLLAAAWGSDPQGFVQRVPGRTWQEFRDLTCVLGRIGGPRVLSYLTRWSRNEDARVRVDVVRALGSLALPSATTVLCELLSDPERRVRQSALWCVATCHDPQALASLQHILFEARFFRDLTHDEQDDFFRTYGRLADENARRELAELLREKRLLDTGWRAVLRRGAALALGESRWPGARDVLERHVRARDRRLREACRAALRALQDSGRTASAGSSEEIPAASENHSEANAGSDTTAGHTAESSTPVSDGIDAEGSAEADTVVERGEPFEGGNPLIEEVHSDEEVVRLVGEDGIDEELAAEAAELAVAEEVEDLEEAKDQAKLSQRLQNLEEGELEVVEAGEAVHTDRASARANVATRIQGGGKHVV